MKGENMKTKLICTILITLMILQTSAFADSGEIYSDVEQGHWAYDYIAKLQGVGVMSGMGDGTFGMGRTMTRAEFVTALGNLMKWEEQNFTSSSFADVDTSAWYFKKIETAVQNGTVSAGTHFRPEEPITREELAVMAVRALGYEKLAGQFNNGPPPFSDVFSNASYIKIAKDFGVVSGMGDNLFSPAQTAAREQAAAIFVRMYDLINNKINFVNGFYAISSASQMNAIQSLDAVSFGWGRLEIAGDAVSLNTSSGNSNEYNIPNGYEMPYNAAFGKPRLLMVAVSDSDSVRIVNNADMRNAAITEIASAINSGLEKDGGRIIFDGVVADFEGLKADSKDNYNAFLTDLKRAMPGKTLYVAVQPVVPGSQAYYDGYDFKAIGDIADKVILMAHDFNPKSLTEEQMAQGIVMTPGAPLKDVYNALLAITDSDTGVTDRQKIALQINFAAVQWKMQGGKVINKTPFTPNYDAIAARIRTGAEIKYSKDYEAPYLSFKNTDDDTDNIVWYEDARSVEAKIKLAKLFGISGISVWRLGNIPDYSADDYLDVLSKLGRHYN